MVESTFVNEIKILAKKLTDDKKKRINDKDHGFGADSVNVG